MGSRFFLADREVKASDPQVAPGFTEICTASGLLPGAVSQWRSSARHNISVQSRISGGALQSPFFLPGIGRGIWFVQLAVRSSHCEIPSSHPPRTPKTLTALTTSHGSCFSLTLTPGQARAQFPRCLRWSWASLRRSQAAGPRWSCRRGAAHGPSRVTQGKPISFPTFG